MNSPKRFTSWRATTSSWVTPEGVRSVRGRDFGGSTAAKLSRLEKDDFQWEDAAINTDSRTCSSYLRRLKRRLDLSDDPSSDEGRSSPNGCRGFLWRTHARSVVP